MFGFRLFWSVFTSSLCDLLPYLAGSSRGAWSEKVAENSWLSVNDSYLTVIWLTYISIHLLFRYKPSWFFVYILQKLKISSTRIEYQMRNHWQFICWIFHCNKHLRAFLIQNIQLSITSVGRQYNTYISNGWFVRLLNTDWHCNAAIILLFT